MLYPASVLVLGWGGMEANTKTALEDVLHFACNVVGISQLKNQQKEAIPAFEQGYDVFVCQ